MGLTGHHFQKLSVTDLALFWVLMQIVLFYNVFDYIVFRRKVSINRHEY